VAEFNPADQLEILDAFEGRNGLRRNPLPSNLDFNHSLEADKSSDAALADLLEEHCVLEIRGADCHENISGVGPQFPAFASDVDDKPDSSKMQSVSRQPVKHDPCLSGRAFWSAFQRPSTSIMFRALAIISLGVAGASFVQPSVELSGRGKFLSGNMSHFNRTQLKLSVAWHGTKVRHDGGMPLDAASELDQASRTWSHRLAEQDVTEPDIKATVQPIERKKQGFVDFAAAKVPAAVVQGVVKAASEANMDPALLMAIADKESSFKTDVKATTSSASGLFQFIESSWFTAIKAFGLPFGAGRIDEVTQTAMRAKSRTGSRERILSLRSDPYVSASLTAKTLKRDGGHIAKQIGRPLTAGETYLVHFLGRSDAERFIRTAKHAPETSAAALLPRPANANKPIFYEKQSGALKEKSVKDVHDAIEAMMAIRKDRYKTVASKVPDGVLAYSD
jgi:hypothetical protein